MAAVKEFYKEDGNYSFGLCKKSSILGIFIVTVKASRYYNRVVYILKQRCLCENFCKTSRITLSLYSLIKLYTLAKRKRSKNRKRKMNRRLEILTKY